MASYISSDINYQVIKQWGMKIKFQYQLVPIFTMFGNVEPIILTQV